MYKVLNKINSPADLKGLTVPELETLAEEIRDRIIRTTAEKGGHLAASLGAVDIAVALHFCLESPNDKVVWDVGHQSYAHKILTGRNERFDTLREMGGLSGFPNKNESEHDPFTAGHSATSISSALGLAYARDLKGEKRRIVAVIGDASLSSGLAFEGINHAGHTKTKFTVILNDNEHSISRPVGAMSRYLNRVMANPLYNRVRREAEKVVMNIPKLGNKTYVMLRKLEEGVKNLLVPGIVFEELGFRYFGPIDGHNIEQLIAIMNNVLDFDEPVLIHVITKKGKGYRFAEEDPAKLHGVPPFEIETGLPTNKKNAKTFTDRFGDRMVKIAAENDKVIAITAAMKDGVGLAEYAEKFPKRFFDVGITEQHAVTFAGGLAKGGFKPVVAIYSTFLQRSYDQLIHDVSLQDLAVVFCLDRAGLVGKDGPTHHGVFDIAYLRHLPHFIVMAPKDGYELEAMLEAAIKYDKPVAIRYPRDYASDVVSISSFKEIEKGKAESLRIGKDIAIIAIGSMVATALDAADVLSSKQKIEAEVINARFIKPLDEDMLEDICRRHKKIVTIEEGVISGGFGSAVLEFLRGENIDKNVHVRTLGLPDEFIEHGSREELLRKYHLAPDEVASTIKAEMF
ncbi:MAG: 1-deoxy-D-xylulose-5-phosphate synthase [Candidatus Omnitrophica bacterium]|nr:1-deoxy-D-xylulose-5-phosphate synthase [Candidatus Omnitrophota bacterium]